MDLHAQIQQMQAQIQALMQNAQQAPQPAAMAAHGGRQLVKPHEYNADPKTADWISFRLHFERVVVANEWTDRQARFALAASMTGMASMIIQDIDPDNLANQPLVRLLNAYQKRFLPASASSKAQCDFETAQQEPREDVLTFHSRLRGLFIRAYPGEDTDTSSNLIRRFCRGVRGEDLQIWLFRQKPTTYEQALEIAHSDFAAKEMVRYNRAAHLKSEPMDINALGPNSKCWNCEKTGHVSRDCKAPRKLKPATKNGPNRNFPPRSNNKNVPKNKPKWRKSIHALIDLLQNEEDEDRYQQILALIDEAEEEGQAEEEEDDNPPEDNIDGQVDASSDFQ